MEGKQRGMETGYALTKWEQIQDGNQIYGDGNLQAKKAAS